MSGSVAEERIRAKVEAGLRAAYPDARIIHELVIGSCRADVAAVSPDDIVLVEIKSERDTLNRLARQAREFTRITRDVRVYGAEKHRAGLIAAASSMVTADGRRVCNPAFVDEMWNCTVWIEREDAGFDLVASPPGLRRDRRIDPSHQFQVLWADEMRWVLGRAGVGQALTRSPIRELVGLAVEHLSGREIRRATCDALRRRVFPRADAPVGGWS